MPARPNVPTIVWIRTLHLPSCDHTIEDASAVFLISISRCKRLEKRARLFAASNDVFTPNTIHITVRHCTLQILDIQICLQNQVTTLLTYIGGPYDSRRSYDANFSKSFLNTNTRSATRQLYEYCKHDRFCLC